MDVDNINNGNSLDSVKVVMPNGVVKEVNPAQQKTVADLIKFCVDADGDSEDFALVFSGRKLKPDQQLCQIPSIDKSKKHPMRLMKQRSQPKPKLNPEEITKLLTECRNSYRTLVEDAHPHVAGDANQMLLNYLDRNGGENYKTVLKDFPMLPYDQLGQDAIRDFRLLIQFVMRDNDFAQKHPHCLLIFKRALDQVAAKYSAASPFVRYGPGAGAGPSNRQPQNAAVAQQQQPALVTQHMLSQALAMALGGGGGGGEAGAGPENPAAPMEVEQQQAAAQPPPPADEHAAAMELGASNYAVQLQQMHDFGFMDDGENIQALMLTNGDVEQALQIVIAMRE